MLDGKFAAEMDRLDAGMSGSRDPTAEARRAAEDFLGYVARDPEWPRLYQEFAAHAARDEVFRAEFAARQRAVRARMAEVFARWATSYGVEPPLPPTEIATMAFCMADGFLLDRIVDPELDDRLYATMSTVFLRGLIDLALDQSPLDGRQGPGSLPGLAPSKRG